MNQPHYKLIYFDGCPLYQPAKKLLNSIDVSFEEICQDKTSSSDTSKQYSSPTLLRGEQVIFGSKLNGTGGGCSIGLPSKDELLNSLKKAGDNSLK